MRIGLRRLMEVYKIPGLSIAVIDNFKIAWARSYGVVETGSNNRVTPKTLFQAGSISKPVAAAGTLALVEQGKLSLDENVNLKLGTWKVPENEFTKAQKVTLRRLMAHTAGLTVSGFPGYDVDAQLPTLVQIFNGEPPANTPPIRVDFVPGTKESYSGGGVTIEQQVMMDVMRETFPVLMRELVLDKIGMTDSSFEQPLPTARAIFAASGTYVSGSTVHGRWHIYPEMAAAGLWTTPSDLAKFAIEIALSKHGNSNRVLSQEMTRQMLTPVIEDSGLGFFLEKHDPGQFGHLGADEGFQALLTMNADSGQGVALMANSDNGIAAAELIVAAIGRENGWQSTSRESMAFGTLLLIARLSGADAALRRYDEFKKSKSPQYRVDEGTLDRVGRGLLIPGKAQNAIKVFERNVQEFPNSSNAYAALAEAYVVAGQKELAIKNYQEAVKLDPNDRSSADALKKLDGTNRQL
jgi:CubicO group peptidase (beta-lactamase class C family)